MNTISAAQEADCRDRGVALISVVVPVYREANGLTKFYARLGSAAEQVEQCTWEFIFVNDGSDDDSLAVLQRLAAQDRRCKIVDLSRNFGKEAALTAGLDHARGDAIVCVDADLQHPPELLGEMVSEWRRGAEVVVAVRRSVAQSVFRKVSSGVFYWIMSTLSDVEMAARTTDYRLLDRRVVQALQLVGERERLFRGLVDWLGFRRAYLQFDAGARAEGAPGYTYRKLWKLAITSLISHSSVPLRLVGVLGMFITIASAVSLVWMFVAQSWVAPRFYYTPLAKATVANTLLIGIVLTALGIMSLYIAKIYAEVTRRPLYAVRQLVNFASESDPGPGCPSERRHGDRPHS